MMKKKSRFGLSTRRKSPSNLLEGGETDRTRATSSAHICPICSASLKGFNVDEAWLHVNSCLDGQTLSPPDTTYELPASEHGLWAVELPASVPVTSRANVPTSPISSDQSPQVLSDLHRAFSKRDLSADKFEIENQARTDLPAPMSPLSRFEENPMQQQVLLLGDAQCGKTWLSQYVNAWLMNCIDWLTSHSAWCTGSIPKVC